MQNICRLFNHVILSCLGIWMGLTLTSCKNTPPDERKGLTDNVPTTSSGLDKSMLLSHFTKKDEAWVLPWSNLLNIHFEEIFIDSLEMEATVPVFNDTLQALNGEIVLVEGFFIPVSETGDENIVILSAFPYAQCFFCGKAGVESIIDVVGAKNLPHIKLDEKIRLKGKLRLNRDDFDYLIYILENAELVR